MDERATTQPDPRELRIAELEAKLAAALKRVGELEDLLRRLQRGSKRQAAPFSKGRPKPNPKTPGRKPGADYGTPPAFRAMPPPMPSDEVIDVGPPAACPHCGDASVAVESIEEQVQREIEVRTLVRRFKVHVVRCGGCGKSRRGRHPLQTSSATGCCASQVGPRARGAMAFMNKTLGLSLGKIADLFATLWELRLTPGGVCHAIQSMGRRCREDYQSIVDAVQNAEQVTSDETGWRVGGASAWLHAAATPEACAYLIDKARGVEATDQLIGPDFAGRLVHDGWKPYDRYRLATHQQCNTHLIRRCDQMIELAPRAAARFPRAVKTLLQKGLDLRDQRDAGQRTPRSSRLQATLLTRRLRKLCKATKGNPANQRLARFLYQRAAHVFAFLRHLGADATNWRGEHAVRYAVVNRKVWGGNRTRHGADHQAILMSVLRTLKLRGAEPIDWFTKKLTHQNPPILC